MTTAVVLRDAGVTLAPDTGRVLARFFVAGREEVGPGESRAGAVIQRLLGLDEAEVSASLRDVEDRFAHRHRDLHGLLRRHAALARQRLGPEVHLSDARLLLLGATFTQEYALEGAALCNPSAVPIPGGDGHDGRFVMSVRGIGEGHRSSIGFRRGTVAPDGSVTLDEPGPFPETGTVTAGIHDRTVFRTKLEDLGEDPENLSFVLSALPERFDDAELHARIEALRTEAATRGRVAMTIANLLSLAGSSYRVEFADDVELSERVLWPHAAVERHGMEDARLVRFVGESGTVTYYGTYTGFDGVNVSQQLLATEDFVSFAVSPMAGAAARGKGLALFPRLIGGRFAALSRSDRESNAVAFSDDLRSWNESHAIQTPIRSWEMLQLGNCGSPIETDRGWLVLTHGVGPMRTYRLGAILLDLHDPRRVLARTDAPILTPGADQRDGYVPNVVYSCGGFVHRDRLVVPYGTADRQIAVATVPLAELLRDLTPSS